MVYGERNVFLEKSIDLNCLFSLKKSFNCSEKGYHNLDTSNPALVNIWDSIKSAFTSINVLESLRMLKAQPSLSNHKNTTTLIDSPKLGKILKPKTMVVVGGYAVGIRKSSRGVVIEKILDVITDKGKKVTPQKNTGLKKGDMILKINGLIINVAEDIRRVLSESKGSPLKVELLQSGKRVETELNPVKTSNGGKYEIGLLVDSNFGVGQLTFYDPEANILAALAHEADDNYTGELLNAKDLELFEVNITGIVKAAPTRWGRLVAKLTGDEPVIGKAYSNSGYGVFGEIIDDNCFLEKDFIPIASRGEVENGPAAILTNINGRQRSQYSIEVEKRVYGDLKGLELTVTDSRLFEMAGGIIQGMSGSPIVQNGKLIGAVSHFIMNNPVRGYGVYAEAMFEKALQYKKL